MAANDMVLTKEVFDQKFKQIEANRLEEDKNLKQFIQQQRQLCADQLDNCIRDITNAIHSWTPTRYYETAFEKRDVYNRIVMDWACEVLSERYGVKISAEPLNYGSYTLHIRP